MVPRARLTNLADEGENLRTVGRPHRVSGVPAEPTAWQLQLQLVSCVGPEKQNGSRVAAVRKVELVEFVLVG